MNVIAFRGRSSSPTPPTTPSSLHLTPMVDLFLERLRVRGAARNTLLAYGSDLRHFVVFALRMGVALGGQVDERLVNRWIDAGMQERGWSRRTAHRKHMTLHSLFQWAIGEGYALRDPMEGGSVIKCQDTDLMSQEIAGHLEAAKQCTRLALVMDDCVSFVLGEDLVVRKLKFLDGAVDQLENTEHDDLRAELDARFALMSGEVKRLFVVLESALKLSKAES